MGTVSNSKAFTWTVSAAPTLAAPTNLRVVATYPTQINLEFTHVTGAANYEVKSSLKGSGSWRNEGLVPAVGIVNNIMGLYVDELSAATAYDFQITPVSSSGTRGASATISATTAPLITSPIVGFWERMDGAVALSYANVTFTNTGYYKKVWATGLQQVGHYSVSGSTITYTEVWISQDVGDTWSFAGTILPESWRITGQKLELIASNCTMNCTIDYYK